MELLRNASGLMVPIGAGRSGRADDPETHISRLNHFGQGMGIDLSSTHSQFTNKSLRYVTGERNTLRGSIDFDSHDEGLQSTRGHISNVEHLLDSNQAKYNEPLDRNVSAELNLRSPYKHLGGIAEDGSMGGYVRKQTSSNLDIFSSWNERNVKGPVTHKDAMQEARSGFGEYMRNGQQGRNAHASDMVDSALDTNEMSPAGSTLRRNYPHYFSPQFLNAHIIGTGGHVNDQVDLKTGNWAKIDPEGYFPD